jgi:hypothetical protein
MLEIGRERRMFDPPPHLETEIPTQASGAAVARRCIRELFSVAAGQGVATDEGFLADVVLLTSEIVSNAVVMEQGCTLSAWYDGTVPAVRVEVFDRSEVVPALPSRRESREVSGRGLRIVDSLATTWGVTVQPGGKTVWFEIIRSRES